MIRKAQLPSGAVAVWRTSQVQATSCHAFNTTGSQGNARDCKAWGRSFVPYTINQDIACPFSPEMSVDNLAVEIQSGLVDSMHHLGINAKGGERIAFRNVSVVTSLLAGRLLNLISDFSTPQSKRRVSKQNLRLSTRQA
jgi:hypothetical protein